MIAVKKPLSLIRAERYVNPAEPSAIIPDVYGSFLAGGVAGAVPAVQIDTVAFVYAAAAHAVGSITAVFIGDVEVTIGVDVTVSLSNNYESQGNIATLTFTGQPAGVVSWRGTGKQDATPATITNAISQLKDLMTTRAQSVGAALSETLDYDVSMRERARSDVEVLGYQTAFVVEDERECGEWINEIMFNVLGHWFIRGDNKLVLYIERAPTINDTDVLAHLVAARDIVHGDYGVEMSGDIQHLVNVVYADYLWSWSLGEALSRLKTPTAEVSFNAHAEVRKNVTLRGHRTLAQVETWCDQLFARQDFRTRVEGAIVKFTVEGPILARATQGDYITLTWAYGPTRENSKPYVNEILRIISLRHSLDGPNGRTAVEAVDTGQFAPNRTDVIVDVSFPEDEEEPELVETGGAGTWWPRTPLPSARPLLLVSFSLNALGDGSGVVFLAPKAGTLHSVEWLGTRGGSASHTARVSFRTPDSSGLPGPVVDQYRVLGGGDYNDVYVQPGAMTSDGTDGGAKRLVAAGEAVCAVIEITTYTAGAISGKFGHTQEPRWAIPYGVTNLAGAGWVASTAFGVGFVALRYADGTYAVDPAFHYAQDVVEYTFNVNTAARDEVGMKFTVPTRWTINQLSAFADLDGDADLVLYENDVAIVTAPVSSMKQTLATQYMIPIAETTLVPGRTYRLTLKPTTTTSIIMSAFQYNAALISASPGGASNGFMCDRVNGGAWTEYTDRKVWMGVAIQKWPQP